MKKRLAIAAVLISVICTLSGCFPTGEKKPNTTSFSDYSENKFFELKENYLDVSFEIPEMPKNISSRIKLARRSYEINEILELFFDGKTIIDEMTWSGNYHADDKSHIYINKDGSEISFNDGETAPEPRDTINFPVNYQMPIHHIKEYFKEEYFPDDELEEFQSSVATERAMELIAKLGLTNFGEPVVFAVTRDSFKKFREYYGGVDGFFNDQYPLTKENEIYYLAFPAVFDGVELVDVSLSIKDNTSDKSIGDINSPTATIGVSQDRIFYFNCGTTYESEYEILSNDPVNYDINYALNELQSYLEKCNFSSRRSAKISEAKIVYLPIEVNEKGTVECVPAWSFEGCIGESNDSFFWSDYKILIRADTGTRIVCEY